MPLQDSPASGLALKSKRGSLPTQCRLAFVGFLFGLLVVPTPVVDGQFRRQPRQQVGNDKPLTAERVQAAIERGVRFIKREQSNGEWNDPAGYPGGVTALATLALLNSGVSPRDGTIQASLRVLDGVDIDRSSTYVVSLMAMVYSLAAPETHRARIRDCAEYLVDKQHLSNDNQRGGWSYGNRGSTPDGSNSQFALLALHEAALVGIEIDEAVWANAKRYWERALQATDGSGGFTYTTQFQYPSGSMTCAAISSLIIIDENLPQSVRLDQRGRILCCGDEDRLPLVESASRWIGSRFTVATNPASGRLGEFGKNYLYYLYGMERAARLSGQRFFGNHDWYREGAEYLVRSQEASSNGSWSSQGHGERDPVVATSFALLFLAKGKRPIVIGKYQHSDDNDWDRHRQGVHFLTRQLEKDWDAKLNWQSIEGRVASADDLLEAPVLFFSGRNALHLNESQKKALRQYIDYGGFIFAEACQGDGCGENVPFDASFRELIAELFPESRLELLTEDHPVFHAQYNLPTNPERPLYGLQSSCRTSIVFCSRNLAGIWKHNRAASRDSLGNVAERDVDYSIQLGANVIAYATGREIRDKLDRPRTGNDSESETGPRSVLIPKLAHGGGQDDAPNAWGNIIRRARFDLQESFRTDRVIISPTMEELAEFPMVFMHGRTPFVWNDAEKAALREYLIDRNGFLFADSICSANGFVESFRDEMRQILNEHQLQVIPPDDPIWSNELGGYNLASVSMHGPAQNGAGVDRWKSPPQLEGIRVNDRWVVVFSPHDLSCAMENASPAQCPGYDKDDAARIGVNVILYALNP